MKLNRLFILLILSLVFYSCENEPVFDNPLDPENPEFIPPETLFVSAPYEGEVINSSSINFSWIGNEIVAEYSYNLDSTGWSEWSSDTTITLNYLDEGLHNFKIKGRYLSLDEDETPAEINFEVDAIAGPSMRVYPLLSESSVGDTVTVDIYFEEVSNVALCEFDLQYNSLISSLVSIESGELLNQFSGETVFINEEISSELIRVDLAVAVGDNPGISNTGSVARIKFKMVSSGNNAIAINNTSLRDNNNVSIEPSQVVNGLMVVE